MAAVMEFIFGVSRTRERLIPSHHHQCYELVYYTCGQGSTQIGTKDWQYGKHQYALIRPSTSHDERREQPTDSLCAGFSLPPSAFPLPEGVFSDDPADPILPLLNKMMAEGQNRLPRFNTMLDLMAGQLVIGLERRFADSSSPSADDGLQTTLHYMNSHFTQKIDFTRLAAKAGYSSDRYRHLFKQKTGYSPVQYIMNKKMEYARTLLQHTKLPVAVIAAECGFSNDAQFCMLFKREHGVTPRQFREAPCPASRNLSD